MTDPFFASNEFEARHANAQHFQLFPIDLRMSLIQAAASSRLQKSQQSQAERRTQRSFAENWDTQTTPIVGGYRVIRKVGGGGFSQ